MGKVVGNTWWYILHNISGESGGKADMQVPNKTSSQASDQAEKQDRQKYNRHEII